MAVTSASTQTRGVETAMAIVTAFCSAGPDDMAGRVCCELVDELDKESFGPTVEVMAAIIEALLRSAAERYDVDPFDVLSGIGAQLYGSIA